MLDSEDNCRVSGCEGGHPVKMRREREFERKGGREGGREREKGEKKEE